MGAFITTTTPLSEEKKQALRQQADANALPLDERKKHLARFQQKQLELRAQKRAQDIQHALIEGGVNQVPVVLETSQSAELAKELAFFRELAIKFDLDQKVEVNLSLFKQFNCIKHRLDWRDDLILLSNWQIVKVDTEEKGLSHELISDATRRAMRVMVEKIVAAATAQ